MRNTLIATSAAALALSASAALAQTSSSGAASPNAGAPAPSASSASSMSGMPGKIMSQDKVRQVMKDAGFSNVQIMDAAYLVQAQTKDGDQLLVLVNAPMMNRGSAAATTGSTAPGTPGTAGSSSSGGSNPSAPK